MRSLNPNITQVGSISQNGVYVPPATLDRPVNVRIAAASNDPAYPNVVGSAAVILRPAGSNSISFAAYGDILAPPTTTSFADAVTVTSGTGSIPDFACSSVVREPAWNATYNTPQQVNAYGPVIKTASGCTASTNSSEFVQYTLRATVSDTAAAFDEATVSFIGQQWGFDYVSPWVIGATPDQNFRFEFSHPSGFSTQDYYTQALIEFGAPSTSQNYNTTSPSPRTCYVYYYPGPGQFSMSSGQSGPNAPPMAQDQNGSYGPFSFGSGSRVSNGLCQIDASKSSSITSGPNSNVSTLSLSVHLFRGIGGAGSTVNGGYTTVRTVNVGDPNVRYAGVWS